MSEFTVTFAGGNGAASLSDELLIRQIAAGDTLALRALLARHQVKVYRFVLRIVRDAVLAEDVVSETFFDVWRHAGRYEGRAAVSTGDRDRAAPGADGGEPPADRVAR